MVARPRARRHRLRFNKEPARAEGIDPKGKFAYVVNSSSNNVSAYSINATTGALTPVKGSPFRAGKQPFLAAVDPTGKFLYIPNVSSNDVSGYSISPTSGALTQVKGSPFGAGKDAEPLGIAVDPAGKFGYTTNVGTFSVSAYSINANGALKLKGSPVGAGSHPIGVATCGVQAGKCIPPPL